jgi:hypothetical protein
MPRRRYAWIVCVTPCLCAKDIVFSIHVWRITRTRCICFASDLTHCVKGKDLYKKKYSYQFSSRAM